LHLGGTTDATMTSASTNPRICFSEGASAQPVYLIYTDADSYRAPAGLKVIGGTSATPAWFEVEGDIHAGGNLIFANSGTAFRGINYGTMGDNDQWRIGGAATASNAGYMELATADDGNEPIYVRQYTGVFTTLKRTLTLLDANGNTTFPGSLYLNNRGTNIIYNGPNDAVNGVGGALNNLVFSSWYGVSFTTSCTGQTYTGTNAVSINCRNGNVYAAHFNGPLTGNVTGNCSGSSGSCTGNAATATKLQTARAINGTNFDGSAAITTANWGTARNFTIKDSSSTNAGTAVSVNGSGAVTLLLPATIKATITGNCSGCVATAAGTSWNNGHTAAPIRIAGGANYHVAMSI